MELTYPIMAVLNISFPRTANKLLFSAISETMAYHFRDMLGASMSVWCWLKGQARLKRHAEAVKTPTQLPFDQEAIGNMQY